MRKEIGLKFHRIDYRGSATKQRALGDWEPAASEAARLFNEIARLNSEILQMDNDEEGDGG